MGPVRDYDAWFANLRQNVKTSDDIFTPPKVYEVILEYINEKIAPIDNMEIQRPFYPGGDYQKDIENYNEKSVVIDNPPFSISSEIVDFYIKNNIKFFIFLNGLTIFHHLNKNAHLLCPYVSITYDNGAKVNTCFIHNLLPKGVTISGVLRDKLTAINKERVSKRKKYTYPNEVLSVAQSLELARRINGEHTITNYKGVSGLNSKGKQKKVFCKAMILSKKEQEKLDKIREELGIIKPNKIKQDKTKMINGISKGIFVLSLLGVTTLFYCYGFNKETATMGLYFIFIIVLSFLAHLYTNTNIIVNDDDDDDDDEVIKFELSERQHKYREAIED